MQGNTDVVTPASVSKPSLQKPKEQGASETLLKDVSLKLFGLMEQVTKNEVTTYTVNSACNCAKQLHKLLELNYKIQKERKYE